VDIYGLSEVIGPGVANECVETKDGLHVWEDHFYPEVIDPVTGEVLPDGEHGELVFTSLTKEAMPIVRYRTRDLTRLLPGTARSMRRIEKITGRSDDMIILRGVNVFPTQLEEIVLRTAGLAPHVTRTGVGKLAIAPCDIAISQDITGFYVDQKQVTPEFLYHRMRQGMRDLKKLNQGTSINGVVRSDFERYPIKLPSLPQQRRGHGHAHGEAEQRHRGVSGLDGVDPVQDIGRCFLDAVE